MKFVTNQKRHRFIADPAVAAEVAENRLRFERGDATISLAEILYAIDHPGTGAEEEPAPKKLLIRSTNYETAG